MLFKAAVFLLFAASTVFAYPHTDAEPILDIRDTSKPLCTTLELPTEEQYRIGYNAFCNTYIPAAADKVLMNYASDPIVATFMLKTHIGTTIPWIFKISPGPWIVGQWGLQREMCFAGFKDYLESEKAKLGTNYCVVDGTGGNGASKGFSGQGFVLVTRRRNGNFDPNKWDGK